MYRLSFVVAVAALVAQANPDVFSPSTVQYNSLAFNHVTKVLAEDGLIVVTDVPGLAEARETVLAEIGKCVLNHGHSVTPVTVTLNDGSIRSTWAEFTVPGSSMPLTSQCPGLQANMEPLRDLVTLGAKYFVDVLDNTVRVKEFDQGLLPRMDGSSYHTFRDMLAVKSEQHLDHFHVYEKLSTNSKPSLEMHTDHGLFIAVVPPVRVFSSGLVVDDDNSFVMETSTGLKRTVRVPRGALLFMIGDGFNYLRQPSHTTVYPVPHALYLESSDDKYLRVWFGRMFFAPSDAYLNSKRDTFQSMIGDHRRLDSTSLGCSSSSARSLMTMDMNSSSCDAGTMYCWMGCLSTSTVSCSSTQTIYCQNSTGGVWTYCDTCHDMGAKLACSSKGAAGETRGSIFAILTLLVAVIVTMRSN